MRGLTMFATVAVVLAAVLAIACEAEAVPTQSQDGPASAMPVAIQSISPGPTSLSLPISGGRLPVGGATAGRSVPSIPLRQAPSVTCQDPQPPLVTDLEVHQTPPIAEPEARAPFRDPVFGTCVVRVTDRKRDMAPDDTAAGFKNEYSRVQSFNSDGTLLLARTVAADFYLYDAATLQPIERLSLDGTDPRWDARDPELLYTSAESRLVSYNVRTRQSSTVHDFASDFPGQQILAVWTRSKGSPSGDGRYWGFMAEDQDWLSTSLLVYDQQSDVVVARRDLSASRDPRGERLDAENVTISPLGNYLVADFSDNYCEQGTLGDDAHPCGIMVYDRELRTGRGVLRFAGHSDLALDPQGREVMVFQDVDADQISMVDLATGALTPLWPIDFSHSPQSFHVSGRALARSGWAVVSSAAGGNPTDFTWMDDQVFLVELKKDGRVVRLAHNHTLYNQDVEHDYWAEPHASPNKDLTRVLFTSNWGRSGTEEVEMLMIQLPPDWPSLLP